METENTKHHPQRHGGTVQFAAEMKIQSSTVGFLTQYNRKLHQPFTLQLQAATNCGRQHHSHCYLQFLEVLVLALAGTTEDAPSTSRPHLRRACVDGRASSGQGSPSPSTLQFWTLWACTLSTICTCPFPLITTHLDISTFPPSQCSVTILRCQTAQMPRTAAL